MHLVAALGDVAKRRKKRRQLAEAEEGVKADYDYLGGRSWAARRLGIILVGT